MFTPVLQVASRRSAYFLCESTCAFSFETLVTARVAPMPPVTPMPVKLKAPMPPVKAKGSIAVVEAMPMGRVTYQSQRLP
jgi:hypothetical protein